MKEQRRAQVIRSYSVVCGRCGHERMTAARDAKGAWREAVTALGWRRSTEYGYVCRDCRPAGC